MPIETASAAGDRGEGAVEQTRPTCHFENARALELTEKMNNEVREYFRIEED